MSTLPPLPAFYVGKTITNNRRANYESEKHGLLSTAISKPDTKSFWYSREHIEQLLAEIDLAEGDGLRICLGMYETGHEFEGQTCLVMIATRAETGMAGPYHANVWQEEEPNFEERSGLSRSFGSNDPGRKRDFNYGSPCPPRCDPE